MFHKMISFVAHLSLRWNLLKSTFSYILRNVSQRNYLMLPDGSYHGFMRIIGAILSNIFRSKGLSQHKESL